MLLRRLILILLTLIISPMLAVLALALLFLNAVRRTVAFTRRRTHDPVRELSGLASIVILNWNGRDLLGEGIPSVLEAVRASGRDHEVIVVDNGSTDGTVEYLAREFPRVRVVALTRNLGFSEGNNAGVREARNDVVVLLNNDMIVDRNFLQPLLEGFGPDTFAVSSQIFLQDPSARREETGKTTATFRRGMVDFSHRPVEGGSLPRKYYPAFWAGGGSSAFHRERFLRLGGFQGVYSPAYVEDADLSYQAWKRGWEVLFAAASIVYHKHRASTARRFSPIALQTLVQRNQLLFVWRNIRSWRLLLSHCLFLPWNCYRLARDCGLGIWLGLIQAAARLPSVARSGFRAFSDARSDREVFSLASAPACFFRNRRADRRFTTSNGSDPRPRIIWMTAYLPHVGKHAGAGRMYQLLKRISRDYRVTLLSFLETDGETEYLPELETMCERVIAMRRLPPPRWQIFPYEPFDEFRTPGMEAALDNLLENCDYSLLQLEYTQMGAYAGAARGIPVLVTKHEVDFAACARRAAVEPGMGGKLRWFYNYLQVLDREIKLLRNADTAICMTRPDAEALRRFCASVPIEVIPTGVDLSYFVPPASRPSTPRLVFVGAFQHLPNVDGMSFFCREVLPRIQSRFPAVELSIVGSNPTPEVLRLAEIPGVRVTGSVSDIRPYMAESSVYVVPLRLGVGIRGKILEAWGMAMAVVATPLSCAGLHCEDGKNLFVAESPSHFADRVVTLLNDAKLRENLGDSGRRTAEEHYGWDASAQKLEALYRRCMENPSACGIHHGEPVGAGR